MVASRRQDQQRGTPPTGHRVPSLDDRDIFRFKIDDAGAYQLTLSDQPAGVGIRYIWDHQGNLWLKPERAPVSSLTAFYEPGTYHVEVGPPYGSEAHTGKYTISLTAVSGDG